MPAAAFCRKYDVKGDVTAFSEDVGVVLQQSERSFVHVAGRYIH